MPKSHPTRSAVVAAVRALLRDPSKACGPRDPVLPITLTERCRGGEMARWDARIDLALTLGALDVLADAGLPRTLAQARNSAANNPTAATVKKVRLLLFRAVDTDKMGDADCKTCIDLATSLIFHEAAFGCSIANGCVSSMCLAQSVRDLRDDRPGEAWLAMRAAMRYAENASEDLTRAPYIPEPLFADIVSYDRMIDRIGIMAGLIVSAEQAEAVSYDDVLRGGAGASPPEWADDLAGLADIIGPDPAPTMVVLAEGALDHLPGSSTSGSYASSRSSTPRGEYQPLAGKALPLVHGADVQAVKAELDREFPWLAEVTEVLLQDLVGSQFTRLRPTLFLGHPGGGKTRFARRVAEVLGLPLTLYSAAGASDGTLGSTSRQWSTGRASVPLQAIQRAGVANPLIVIDEVDKSGTRTDSGRLWDVLLSMTEAEGARQYHDSYLETAVDLSAVSYLATANDLGNLPGPLLDRFRVLRVGSPRAQDLPAVAAAIVGEIRTERGIDEAWLPDLAHDELGLLAQHWRGGSLRGLRRMVETMVAGRDALARRH